MAWLYKQKFSQNWWLGCRVNGRQVLRSTGTSDRKKAEVQLAQVQAVHHAHKAGSLTDEFVRLLTGKQAATDVALQVAIQQWLSECKDLAPNTRKRYEETTREFCQAVKATETTPLLRKIQSEAVAAFLRAKRATTSTATAKLCRRILAAFFNYCIDNQLIGIAPVPSTKALKLIKDSNSGRRAFTLAELKLLYEKAPTPFWKFMVLAGFYLGQRMGDLIQMAWGAVDFENNFVRLKAGKTGKFVQIPLRAELRSLLWNLNQNTRNVRPSASIWPEQAKRYAERGAGAFSNEFYDEVLLPAGLVPPRTHHARVRDKDEKPGRRANPVSYHCLRHTFVSLLKITGAGQATAKELAGHSSDVISDIYTHVDEATLTKAINQLPRLETRIGKIPAPPNTG